MAGGRQLFRGGAPLLASVELLEMSLLCCWLPFNAVLTLQLTENQMLPLARSMRYDRFRELLVALPTLKYLILSGWVIEFGPEDVLSAIEMPSLLSIDFTPTNVM
jgi:hypothetical protein